MNDLMFLGITVLFLLISVWLANALDGIREDKL